MKKLFFTFSMGLLVLAAQGQQTQGRVLYERTAQLKIHLEGGDEGMARSLPKSHTDKLEVLFANNRCLRRPVQDETPEPFNDAGNGMMHFNMRMGGPSEITYADFSTGQQIEQAELGVKTYIVTDSLEHMQWKLTGATTTILNYPCQQAVTQRIGKRMATRMENGEMKNEEVADTSNITVWFTPSIPVPAGPDFQGQLPGLILGIDVNDGRVVYKAVEVSPEVDIAAIKAPSKGKKITAAEFANARKELMEEMQRNMKNSGRGMMIRIGG